MTAWWAIGGKPHNDGAEFGITYVKSWSGPGDCTYTTSLDKAQRFYFEEAVDYQASLIDRWPSVDWGLYHVGEESTPVVDKPICYCYKCGEKNEFAEPNRPEGKYECFSCRRYQRPW